MTVSAKKMNVLKKIAGAKAAGPRVHFRDGDYVLTVEDVILKLEGFKGDNHVTVFRVDQARKVDVFSPGAAAKGENPRLNIEPNAEGTTVSWAVNLAGVAAGGNLKSFYCALIGENPESVDPDDLQDILSYFTNTDPTAIQMQAKRDPNTGHKVFTTNAQGEPEVVREPVLGADGQLLKMPVGAAKGMRVRMSTFRTMIKGGNNAGQDFVGMNWQHFTQTPEEIEANRKTLR
jgi:hypothetical protein